jgi:DNA-binding transcriptional regulator LsrR (DeoR family)
MGTAKRWHPSEESDEIVFAVCSRFLEHLGKHRDARAAEDEGHRRGAAAAIATWLREQWNRGDLTRERIYPLLWEAARRNYLLLLPPRETSLARRIAERYGVAHFAEHEDAIQVVNVRGPNAFGEVASVGADTVLELIQRLGKKKDRVHVGLGAGYAAMMVAKRLAHRVYSDSSCPPLALHALSSGGFSIDKPQKAPITYFSYFDGVLADVECVALFSETVVSSDEYERVKRGPGARRSFERAGEIDIVITSLASALDADGLLGQYLEHLIRERELDPAALKRMQDAGWVGDVQFRPYNREGPIIEECPVRAVTLFDLSDLVRMAGTDDKYVVLLGGPCGECGRLKTDALIPLLTRDELRLWTHLIVDVQTAGKLLSGDA